MAPASPGQPLPAIPLGQQAAPQGCRGALQRLRCRGAPTLPGCAACRAVLPSALCSQRINQAEDTTMQCKLSCLHPCYRC